MRAAARRARSRSATRARPALAARAQPAQRLPACWRRRCGATRARAAAGTSARRRGRAAGGWIVDRLDERWPGERRWERDAGEHPHEARYLHGRLASARASGSAGRRAGISSARSDSDRRLVCRAARRRRTCAPRRSPRSTPSPRPGRRHMTSVALPLLLRRPLRPSSPTSACRRCELLPHAEQRNAMEPFYPLRALVCAQCFLVQLEEFETPEHIFSRLRLLLVVLRRPGSSTRAATPSDDRALRPRAHRARSSRSRATTATCCSTSSSAASRCSASSRPPTSRRGRRARRASRRWSSSSASRPRARLAPSAGRPAARQQRARPRAGPQRLRRRHEDRCSSRAA